MPKCQKMLISFVLYESKYLWVLNFQGMRKQVFDLNIRNHGDNSYLVMKILLEAITTSIDRTRLRSVTKVFFNLPALYYKICMTFDGTNIRTEQ